MGDRTTLGLDLGKTLGWCFAKNGVILNSGTIALAPEGCHKAWPLVNFKQTLQGFKGLTEIVYESIPFQTSKANSRMYDGMLGQLEIFCFENSIALIGIPNGTLKKDFAGHGHAKKPDMCAVAHRMGWKHGELGTDLDHDECDACACIVVWYKHQNEPIHFK